MVSLYAETSVALSEGSTACRTEPAISLQPVGKPPRLIQRLIAGLGLTVLTVCSVVIAYAHLQPVSDAAMAFGLARCAGVPCFRNMTPGQTSWADVRVAYSDPLPAPVTVSVSADGVSVGAIYIHPRLGERVTLGEIVTLYGTPCRVIINIAPYRHWRLFYPSLQVETFADDSLNPNQPVSDMTFTDPAVPAAPCAIDTPASSSLTVQRSWQGFTSIQRYLKAVPEQQDIQTRSNLYPNR